MSNPYKRDTNDWYRVDIVAVPGPTGRASPLRGSGPLAPSLPPLGSAQWGGRLTTGSGPLAPSPPGGGGRGFVIVVLYTKSRKVRIEW